MQTMIRRRPTGIAVALLVVFALTACAGEMRLPPNSPPAGEARTVEHQGAERHYYLHNAEAAAAAPAPLVVFAATVFRRKEKALAERENPSSRSRGDALDRVASREGFDRRLPPRLARAMEPLRGLA